MRVAISPPYSIIESVSTSSDCWLATSAKSVNILLPEGSGRASEAQLDWMMKLLSESDSTSEEVFFWTSSFSWLSLSKKIELCDFEA